MDRLPNVPRSNGDTPVWPISTRTAPGGTRSSSATSSDSAPRVPCPASTLPVKAVTIPSGPTCSQARVLVANTPGAGSCPATLTRPPEGSQALLTAAEMR